MTTKGPTSIRASWDGKHVKINKESTLTATPGRACLMVPPKGSGGRERPILCPLVASVGDEAGRLR